MLNQISELNYNISLEEIKTKAKNLSFNSNLNKNILQLNQ